MSNAILKEKYLIPEDVGDQNFMFKSEDCSMSLLEKFEKPNFILNNCILLDVYYLLP